MFFGTTKHTRKDCAAHHMTFGGTCMNCGATRSDSKSANPSEQMIEKGTRVFVTRPAYGKPFYGEVRMVYRNSGKPQDEGVYSSHHGKLTVGYLIQRSENSGALWYDRSDFRLLKKSRKS